jgi:mono/diheme cytochrome c family protein
MRCLHALAFSALLLPLLGLAALGTGSHAQETSRHKSAAHKQSVALDTTSAARISFRADIEPLLQTECSSCHSADKHSGGFVVETPESLFKGGSKSGASVIVPGKAHASTLLAYLRGQKQPRMPFGKPALPAEQIDKIAAWIDQGAKIDAVKLGWPYTPPVARAIPHVKNAAWCRNPIDNFVLAKLEAKGLKPAPPASRIVLLRRVYADLIGEPPGPQEADAFLKDSSPQAYEHLVDRLLADPRYGERWARHWLDLVRYADSNGFEFDAIRPRAWRFRDYVIRAFNADKPYDRFLKEQIAGDELYPNDPDAITATGYARLGTWDDNCADPAQRWQDYLNDVTDTTGSVMLGLTLGCARCHNHKYDRITQADYYRMQSFFAPSHWVDTPLPADGNDPAAFRQKVANADAHIAPLRQQLQALRDKHRALLLAKKQQMAKPGEKVQVSDDEINASIEQTDLNQREQLNAELGSWESRANAYRPIAEAISEDRKDVPKTFLLLRGNLRTPGPEVQPGFIASLVGGKVSPAPITLPADGKTTGRRTALANWIASKDNPMTARVLVNRLWQHHFGRGIEGTPSDFGKNGDPPTHPELLDWLAVRFMQDGWSLKKIHRLMLLSSAYQQSSRFDPASARLDPTNALLWRMNRIRLEGETLRDSILTVSGRLNPEQGGPGVFPHVSDEVLSTGSTHKWGESSEEEGRRRTIYVFQRRSLMLPLVEAYDGADMSNTCPRRAVTTIAPQALALFNGEFSRTESRFFAARVVTEVGEDPGQQIERAYKIALIRPPTPAQKALALDFLTHQTQLHLQASAAPHTASDNTMPDLKARQEAEHAALTDFCHVLINTNEFLYLD